MGLFRTASVSVRYYIHLVNDGSLKLSHKRIGDEFKIEDGSYRIFRETVSKDSNGATVILVIGFRLKLIRSVPLLHWLFQRVCVITTPFWSGLPGFKTKLWMVDPTTKNYMGIYDWKGRDNAQAYLDFLIPILNFFSVNGSVHARQIFGSALDDLLEKHRAAALNPTLKSRSDSRVVANR